MARNQRRRASILLYAVAQFGVLTIIAMLVHPGGAVFQKSASHYLFLSNFFSDLGATKTINGDSNLASHILFIIASVSVGIALILFSPVWKEIARDRDAAVGVGNASQVLLVVSGLGFIGVALTPWDLVLDAHNLFVQIAFGVLLAYVLCVIVVQAKANWPRPFLGINIAYVFVLAAYVVILFFGPDLDTKGGLEFQVAAQKAIVYSSIAALGVQAFSVFTNSRALTMRASTGVRPSTSVDIDAASR